MLLLFCRKLADSNLSQLVAMPSLQLLRLKFFKSSLIPMATVSTNSIQPLTKLSRLYFRNVSRSKPPFFTSISAILLRAAVSPCLNWRQNHFDRFPASPLVSPAVCSQDSQQTRPVRHKSGHISPLLQALPRCCPSRRNPGHHVGPTWSAFSPP